LENSAPAASPDGFEWGYAGSGPSTTAQSILTDYLGGVDALPTNAFGERVVPCHQDFKQQFIAAAAHEGFTITDVEIAAFLVVAEARESIKADG
jgi:hypothetical protein